MLKLIENYFPDKDDLIGFFIKDYFVEKNNLEVYEDDDKKYFI
jgi:hypothetical protein